MGIILLAILLRVEWVTPSWYPFFETSEHDVNIQKDYASEFEKEMNGWKESITFHNKCPFLTEITLVAAL